jgi:5-(carboxyamino)imidazole ribonucleotide synthase
VTLQPSSLRPDGQPVTLGVLGGGQLGRMFVHAAQTLGFRTAVLDPDPDSPAGRVSHLHLKAEYGDEPALAALVQACDAVTTEFENVPAQALRVLARHRPVAPSAEAVAVCQHRGLEKAHFTACGVPCVPHARLESAADLASLLSLPKVRSVPGPAPREGARKLGAARRFLGRQEGDELFPAILKTSTLGYDGKGQVRVERRDELAQAWARLREAPCVLEKRVPLTAELSVVVARDVSGQVVHLPVQQNLHRDGILAVTWVPAPDVPAAVAAQAVAHATAVAQSLRYVGVLCVEFFLLEDGTLLANEMAPRPHNSGHHSIDACDVSQFDLQVRALAGLPLVVPRLHSPAVMLNLLGDLWFAQGSDTPEPPSWSPVLALPGTHLHLYGKIEARRGRKMGHLTVTAARAEDARSVALQAAALLGLDPF